MAEIILKGPVSNTRRRPSLVLIAAHLEIPDFGKNQIEKVNKRQISVYTHFCTSINILGNILSPKTLYLSRSYNTK